MGPVTATMVAFAIGFLIKWIFLTIVFYIAGRAVTGINTKGSDALIVAFIGALISEILHYAFSWFIITYGLDILFWWLPAVGSALITFIVYIPLFMKFFDAGLGGAIAIGLLCLILYIIIGIAMIFILAFLVVILLLGP